MPATFREVEHPDLFEVIGVRRRILPCAGPGQFSWDNIELVGSGKAGLSLVLAYLRLEGRFENKMCEVVVPGWLGYWVYNQVQSHLFPSRSLSTRSRAILAYHQYGFPQNMDRILEVAGEHNLVVIEDCAHTLYGNYKGKQLGSIGDFSIYSFSKFFFCYALGAVRTQYPGFSNFAAKQRSGAIRGLVHFINWAKLISEYSLKYPSDKYSRIANALLSMSYALYGQSPCFSRKAELLAKNKINGEITIRDKYYQYFRQRTDHLGICDHLEPQGVYPYVIPIMVNESCIDKIISKLCCVRIRTGKYMFDVNRFLLEPDFKPSVWIVCHGGISESVFEQQVEVVLKTL